MDTVRYSRFRAWAALIVLAVLSAPALAASRVALVVGNASYAHAPTLANPLNDAADIAATLARLGFSVTRLENADYATLRRGLQKFTRTASGSEVAVVYYAGHGIEVDQRNYLVPVDARLANDHDVEFETVALDLVVRAAERASGLRLVILDACRDNPFAASMRRAGTTRSIGRGLARVEPTGSTLVAYAAKGGTVAADGDGRNSPYTEALLAHLEEPGLEVGMMFRRVRDAVLDATRRQQEPFVYGSLSSEMVYLKAPMDTSPAQQTATPVAAPTFDEAVAAHKRSDYAVALRGFRRLAERGNAGAQSWLGFMYYHGQGVAEDHSEAVRWYRKAAEQGNAWALNNLGAMYAEGQGVAQSHTEAVRWYRKAAEQGYANAQFNLGVMYHNGLGGAQSDTEAVRWYRKAADQDYASAQFNLGFMYQHGKGVAQSDAEAVRWYQKAAEQGNAAAQSNLGVMYEYGKGVAVDDAEAARWYRRAAEQGNAIAQSNLGVMYEFGKGVAQNHAEAVRWYQKAAEQGNAIAQNNLGLMHAKGEGVARNDAEAVRWYQKAAEQGNAAAQTSLGNRYKKGLGVARNYVKALHWLRKAAEQSYAPAQYSLGVMYHTAVGVKWNETEAARWYRLAAKQGYALAIEALKRPDMHNR